MVWESDSSNSKMAEYQNYITLVEDRLSVGAEKSDVAKQLIEMGLSPGEANGLVEKVAQRTGTYPSLSNVSIAARARGETAQVSDPVAATTKLSVFIAAFGAAIVAGFIWSVIVTVTGYELGYAALGVGFLVGFAVMSIADGTDNFIVPFISAVAAGFGIAFGKYLTFIHFFNEYVVELQQEASAELQEGADLAMEFSSIGIFNALPVFMEMGLDFGRYEYIWFFLAVSTAWGIAAYDS